MSPDAWSSDDRETLARRGVSAAEAERQLALLRDPPPPIAIERPCTPGDGIEQISGARAAELSADAARAAASGRITEFVPASGAASRMFKDLLTCLAEPGALTHGQVEQAHAAGRAEFDVLARFTEGIDRFPFRVELRAALATSGYSLDTLAANGPYRPLLETLLGGNALNYALRPKGLLPFHAYADGVRTAFDEHLVDAAEWARDAQGQVRAHFTVSPEHRTDFSARLHATREAIESRQHVRLDVGFSTQDVATDTLAIDDRGAPVRDTRGALLLRPAGHGALIGNLGGLGADLVLIKNIDNVAIDALKPSGSLWTRVLIGRVVEIDTRLHAFAQRIAAADPHASDEAIAYLRGTFGAAPANGVEPHAWLLDMLDRPLRVCGMVPNTGEPGGGPFWVRNTNGTLSRQIVEGAQVGTDPLQRAAFAHGTHFNPVFMACSVRDRDGNRFDLERFVDPAAVILTHKSAGGRELLALERPGLWNGAMAHWHTVFVEVPLEVFNPVKTVLDLLRPAHQP